MPSDPKTTSDTRVFVAAVQEVLRSYADMMERGEVPELHGPAALRRAAEVMEGQSS